MSAARLVGRLLRENLANMAALECNVLSTYEAFVETSVRYKRRSQQKSRIKRVDVQVCERIDVGLVRFVVDLLTLQAHRIDFINRKPNQPQYHEVDDHVVEKNVQVGLLRLVKFGVLEKTKYKFSDYSRRKASLALTHQIFFQNARIVQKCESEAEDPSKILRFERECSRIQDAYDAELHEKPVNCEHFYHQKC